MAEKNDWGRAVFGTWFLGIPMIQWWSDMAFWERVFNTHGPSLDEQPRADNAPAFRQVIELGSGRGAMSMYLLLQCTQRGIAYTGFDHVATQIGPTPLGRLLNIDSHIITGDLWSELNSGKLRALIADPANHPLLLFCDNGNKPREFQTFAPLLRAGDVVAVHDWKNEFTDADVPEAMKARLRVIEEGECNAQGVLTRWWDVIA